MNVCKTWGLAVELCALRHGKPLPVAMLRLGSPDVGWGLVLNASRVECDAVPAFGVSVTWNGFPAGLCGADGGVIAAGSVANEAALLEWLESELAGAAGGEGGSSAR